MLEMTLIQKIALAVIPVLFAITGHEVAHGWVASRYGDQTARFSGRLTLNPLKHIDIVGTVLVPLLLFITTSSVFGWAKPVPVDARNLRSPRSDMIKVALAGPVANLLMAFMWAAIAKISLSLPGWFGVPLVGMGIVGIQINLVLGILNCLPIPGLDGGTVLCNALPPRMAWHFSRLQPYGIFILLLLMGTQVLFYIISPPLIFFMSLITRFFGLGI